MAAESSSTDVTMMKMAMKTMLSSCLPVHPRLQQPFAAFFMWPDGFSLRFKAAGTVGWMKVKNDEKMFEAAPEELIS